ncbi:MAG: protein kinase [Proteobacteria bacterium]|nr:protein kinase [Pseudomonadota bacterium]MCP4921588.1 protein kinase [Pseudomonadota bacterium]
MMLLPKKIGPLTLQRKLGTGGVAESYLGVQEDGTRVLCRRVLPFVRKDARRLASVEARVRDLLGIKHPFLVQALDWVQVEGECFAVESWVEGIDLERVLAWCRKTNTEIPHNVFLNIATQICSALEVMHGRPGKGTGAENVLHLGLQPAHLFVTPESKVQVGGFALLRSPTALPQGGMAGPVPTRMEYLSPEQTHPDQRLQPASDVFALGAILYELLTLEPLFRADSNLQTIHRVRRAEVSGPLAKVKERMPGLDKVLFRALSLNPRHRYQRAFVLREDLRGLMAGYSFASIADDTRAFLAPIEAETTGSFKPQPTSETTAAKIAVAAPPNWSELGSGQPSTDDLDPDEWNEPPTDLHVMDEPKAPAGPPSVVAQVRGAPPPLAPEHPMGRPMPESDPADTAAFLVGGAAAAAGVAAVAADGNTWFGGDEAETELDHGQGVAQAWEPPVSSDIDEPADTAAFLPRPALETPEPTTFDAIPESAHVEPEDTAAHISPPAPPPTLYPEDELNASEEATQGVVSLDDKTEGAIPAPLPPSPQPSEDVSQDPTETGFVDVPLLAKPEAAPPPVDLNTPPPWQPGDDAGRPTLPAAPPPSQEVAAPKPLSRPDPTAEVPAGEPEEKSSNTPLIIGAVAAVLFIACAGIGGVGYFIASSEPPDLEIPAIAAIEESPETVNDALAELTEAPEEAPEVEEAPEEAPDVEEPVAIAPSRLDTEPTREPTYVKPEPKRTEPTYTASSTYAEPKGSSSYAATDDDDDLFASLGSDDGLVDVALDDPLLDEGSDLSEATNLDSYVSDAKSGDLSSMDVGLLEMVEDTDPSYTRSRALLLMNAEQKGDTRQQKAYLSELMILPENRYNSVYLSKQATLAVNGGSYQTALDKAKQAERYWARIPSDLVFSTKADIYAAQAAAYQGLFYKDGEDMELLDDAIRGWEKYQRHVLTKGDSSRANTASAQIEKLEDIRQRLE